MSVMKKLYAWYCTVEEVICGILFSSIVVLVFSSALFRQFNHPLIWADDIAKLCFAWVAFLGADVAMRKCRLVGVDFIMKKIPFLPRNIFYIAGNLVIFGILVLLVYYGIDLSQKSWNRYFQTINVSYTLVTISFPIGACAMILTTGIKIVKLITHINDANYSLSNEVEPEDMERQTV